MYLSIHIYIYIYIYRIIMGCIYISMIECPLGLIIYVNRKHTCRKKEIRSRRIISTLNLCVRLYGCKYVCIYTYVHKYGHIVNMGDATMNLHGSVPCFQSLCLKYISMSIMIFLNDLHK